MMGTWPQNVVEDRGWGRARNCGGSAEGRVVTGEGGWVGEAVAAEDECR